MQATSLGVAGSGKSVSGILQLTNLQVVNNNITASFTYSKASFTLTGTFEMNPPESVFYN